MHSEPAALASIARSAAVAAVANSRGDIVTCGGCKAKEQGGDWGQGNCENLCRARNCQRQVYASLVMTRLCVELVRVLVGAGYSELFVRDVLGVE